MVVLKESTGKKIFGMLRIHKWDKLFYFIPNCQRELMCYAMIIKPNKNKLDPIACLCCLWFKYSKVAVNKMVVKDDILLCPEADLG